MAAQVRHARCSMAIHLLMMWLLLLPVPFVQSETSSNRIKKDPYICNQDICNIHGRYQFCDDESARCVDCDHISCGGQPPAQCYQYCYDLAAKEEQQRLRGLDCPPLPTIVNGNHNGTATERCRQGTVVVSQCDAGYQLQGALFTVCEEYGRWSNELPLCTEKNCGQPPMIRHSIVNLNRTSYVPGAIVSYTCEDGYQLEYDSAVWKCQHYGTWEWSGVPHCSPTPYSDDSVIINFDYSTQSSADSGYSSDNGTELKSDRLTIVVLIIGISIILIVMFIVVGLLLLKRIKLDLYRKSPKNIKEIESFRAQRQHKTGKCDPEQYPLTTGEKCDNIEISHSPEIKDSERKTPITTNRPLSPPRNVSMAALEGVEDSRLSDSRQEGSCTSDSRMSETLAKGHNSGRQIFGVYHGRNNRNTQTTVGRIHGEYNRNSNSGVGEICSSESSGLGSGTFSEDETGNQPSRDSGEGHFGATFTVNVQNHKSRATNSRASNCSNININNFNNNNNSSSNSNNGINASKEEERRKSDRKPKTAQDFLKMPTDEAVGSTDGPQAWPSGDRESGNKQEGPTTGPSGQGCAAALWDCDGALLDCDTALLECDGAPSDSDEAPSDCDAAASVDCLPTVLVNVCGMDRGMSRSVIASPSDEDAGQLVKIAVNTREIHADELCW